MVSISTDLPDVTIAAIHEMNTESTNTIKYMWMKRKFNDKLTNEINSSRETHSTTLTRYRLIIISGLEEVILLHGM